MHKNFRKNRKTVRQILNHHFDRFGKCDRIKMLASHLKMSTLCGVNVKLSKSENLNVDDKIITRAVFKLNKHTYVMDGINIEPFEFTEMVSELLSKLTNK